MRGFIPLFSPVSSFFVFYLLLFCYDSNTDVAFQIHYHCCFSTFPKWHHDETEHHASISLIITFSKETDRFQIYVDDESTICIRLDWWVGVFSSLSFFPYYLFLVLFSFFPRFSSTTALVLSRSPKMGQNALSYVPYWVELFCSYALMLPL